MPVERSDGAGHGGPSSGRSPLPVRGRTGGDGDADEAQQTPGERGRCGYLPEQRPGQPDHQRRDRVRGGGQPARGRPGQGVSPGQERDTGREHSQVDDAGDGRRRRGGELGDQRGQERQQRDGPGDGTRPGHGQGVDPGQQPLLCDGRARVQERGEQPQQHPGQVGAPGGGGRRDERHPGERHTHPGQQPCGEALPEEQPGQDGDDHRRHVHQQRGGAGVEVPFGRVQREVVDAEPGRAPDRHRRQQASTWCRWGRRASPRPHHGADRGQGERSDHHPARGERARGQVVPDGADADEGRRPQHHGDRCGERRQSTGGTVHEISLELRTLQHQR